MLTICIPATVGYNLSQMRQKIKTVWKPLALTLSVFATLTILLQGGNVFAAAVCVVNANPARLADIHECMSATNNTLPAETFANDHCYTVAQNQSTGYKFVPTDIACSTEPFGTFIKNICNANPQASPLCSTVGAGITEKPDTAAAGCLDGGETATGCGLVDKYIQPLINVLAGAVGLIVTINIIIGGVQYSAAGGDPQKVANARKRIYNSVFGLVAFGLLYSFMQWLVPGGLF